MGDKRVQPGLISFEGMEKVGKTTQIRQLALWLRSHGKTVTVLREPGGTMLGETLRGLLLHKVRIQSAAAEFLLFAAARAELVKTVIRPALEQGHMVILDRYLDSSAAYQGFGRGLDVKWVKQVNDVVTQGLKPSLTFWLKGPAFMAGDDNIEREGPAFFARVQQGYQDLSQEEPQRWRIISSAGSVEAIAREIREAVQKVWSVEPEAKDLHQ
jgi:dTMP kinase